MEGDVRDGERREREWDQKLKFVFSALNMLLNMVPAEMTVRAFVLWPNGLLQLPSARHDFSSWSIRPKNVLLQLRARMSDVQYLRLRSVQPFPRGHRELYNKPTSFPGRVS